MPTKATLYEWQDADHHWRYDGSHVWVWEEHQTPQKVKPRPFVKGILDSAVADRAHLAQQLEESQSLVSHLTHQVEELRERTQFLGKALGQSIGKLSIEDWNDLATNGVEIAAWLDEQYKRILEAQGDEAGLAELEETAIEGGSGK